MPPCLPGGEPKALAIQILAETRTGPDANTHHVALIEAAPDILAQSDQKLAAAVRTEVSRHLSIVEQGQLRAGEPGRTAPLGNGATVRFAPAAQDALTPDAWIARESKAGSAAYDAVVQLAGSPSHEAVKATLARLEAHGGDAGAAARSRIAELTGSSGGLAALATSGVAAPVADPAIGRTAWGTALQLAATGVRTKAVFEISLVSGVYAGAKDLVVGLATLAGGIMQYSADVGGLGASVDTIRDLLPGGTQAWMKDQALIPSAQRGAVTAQKLAATAGAIGTYLSTHTLGQAAGDIGDFIATNWGALKADHAKAVAQGPEAAAKWWGQVAGRAAFEVAALAVPVTKLGLAGKVANGATDLARVAGKVVDLTKLRQIVAGSANLARGDAERPLGSAARGEIEATIGALGRIDGTALPAAERAALAQSRAALEEALEIAAPRNAMTGNPAPIARGYGELSSRQQSLLARLPDDTVRIIIAKADIGIMDIAALTAKTGDEFAIFTKGAERMILRRTPRSI